MQDCSPDESIKGVIQPSRVEQILLMSSPSLQIHRPFNGNNSNIPVSHSKQLWEPSDYRFAKRHPEINVHNPDAKWPIRHSQLRPPSWETRLDWHFMHICSLHWWQLGKTAEQS